MTIGADLLRDRRRADAVPGGARDRRIRVLFNALPVGVGMVLAVMIITPIFPRGEISFLLDRTKVAMTHERLLVNHANYRGEDDQGRAFSLSAGQAVQHSARVPVVQMQDLVARMQMADGPTDVTAKIGSYEMDKERVLVSGPVQFSSADGYRMTTSAVAVDLKSRRAFGAGGVSGSMQTGTFGADRMGVDLNARTVTLEGRAHLRMTPGQKP
jgi:lipopolysaccharide export system protein LptC